MNSRRRGAACSCYGALDVDVPGAYPAEMTGIRRSYQYKASLSRGARDAAVGQLHLHAELYNAALEERREAWRRQRVSVTVAMQSAQLPELKRLRPELAEIDAQATQAVLQRLDRAYQAFFRRVKAGQTPGFPRFKSRHRYDSITFKQTGWSLEGRHLTLRGIGRLKLFLSRPIEGRIKTVTLKRDAVGDWFVTFSCDDVPVRDLEASDAVVGIDLGLEAFLTTSDGERVDNLRPGDRDRARVARKQRVVSKRTKGSRRRRKAVRHLARAHRRIERVRRDWHHKVALSIVRRYGMIAVEDLNVLGLSRGRLARSVNDAAWGQFLQTLADKAASAGRTVIPVDPRGTSQECSACGAMPETPKRLSERWHQCESSTCGYETHRDENAAANILARGLAIWLGDEAEAPSSRPRIPAGITVGAPPSASWPASRAAA